MAKTTPKKGRSASRGRAAAKPAKPATPAKAPAPATPKSPKHEMEFDEGDKIMARWPGTNLFFNAKVSYVRDDDNEYDVTFEDGTVFTLKAKDVKKEIKPRKSTPSRSQSRGRSPARKTAKAAAAPKSPAKVEKPAAPEPPKVDMTPTRVSARIAAAKAKAAESADEEEPAKKTTAKSKAAAPAAAPSAASKLCACLSSLSFAWLGTLFFMILSPLILISLHILCTKDKCKPEIPNFPKDVKAYWDPQAFAAVFGFAFVLRLLSLLPVGRVVTSVSGNEVRLNGLFTLLTLLSAVPALVYRKIDVSFVADKYFHIMVSSLILAFVFSTVAAVLAKFFGDQKSNVNPRGNTGNPIVDFFNGRELNPFFARADLKLQTFRFSIIGLAVLNVLLVLNSVAANKGQINPVVALAAAFQVAYALDAMYFEEFYFFSYDAMNSGYGFALVSSYHSFPFLTTLVTRYLVVKAPAMEWYYLVAIGLMNLIGYIIFRKTETQRCQAAKDPAKLLEEAQGFWSYVRHPNYLGEILIQWSWVLPAACTAGRVDLLIYYLPVFTTLMILCRCSQQNKRNEKKLGAAWTSYCQRVPSNLIPKVF